MKVLNSLGWLELTVMGSLLLMIFLWNVVPIVVKRRMKQAGLNRSVSFFRKNIRTRYKQEQKSKRQNLKQVLKDWMTGDEFEALVLISMVLLFGTVFSLFVIPKILFLLVVLGYCIWRLVFSCKFLFSKHLPAYTVFQGNEVGILIRGDIYFHEEQMSVLNQKMINAESAVEFSRLQPIAIKVIALQEAILNAGSLLDNEDLDENERGELEQKLETVVGLLKRRKQDISESRDVWLHMTGKQLHTGFNTFAEIEMQEELDRTDVFSKETTLREKGSQPINPAIADLLEIVNDTKIDQITRTLAKDTIKEIERKLLGEALRSEHATSKMSAMASIVTARNMYDLDESKTPVE